MSTHPFTIIDGVPRDILAEALKNAASKMASDAQKHLTERVAALAAYVRAPDGRPDQFPKLERVDDLLATVIAARDSYRVQKEIADGAYTQAIELEQQDSAGDAEVGS